MVLKYSAQHILLSELLKQLYPVNNSNLLHRDIHVGTAQEGERAEEIQHVNF